jgi:hypothetical protein
MVTQNELRAFYETDLMPKLLFFEEQRKLLLSKRRTLWNIFWILLIFAIFVMISALILVDERELLKFTNFNNKGDFQTFLTIAIIIYLVIIVIVIKNFYKKMKSSYQTHFKKAVVASLVTFIDENLSYTPKDNSTVNKGLFKKEFQNSHLFRGQTIYSFRGEDYVGGILGGISINFSEILATERVVTGYSCDEDGYCSDEYSILNIFKGLFFVFDVNSDFEGVTTVIIPNTTSSYRFKKYLPLVKLAKPALESEFIVYSDNPMIAKYVFSTAFMQRRLLALRSRLKTPVQLSFVNGKLYMAIPVSEDLFEPPVFSTVLDFQLIQTTFEYMQLGKEMVEELITLLKQPNSMNLE